MIQMSTGMKNAVLDAAFNAGSQGLLDSNVLEIRTGAAPGPNLAATGTLLCSMTLPADAIAAASGGTAAKAGTWSGTGAAGGAAAHFRTRASGDANAADSTQKRIEGSCGIAGANQNIGSAALQSGQVEITITAHGYSNGDEVLIAGHSVAAVNGRWTINTVAANTFRIPVNVSPGTGGTVRRCYDLELDNTSIANTQAVAVNSVTLTQNPV